MRVAWVVLFLATWLIGGQASASGLPLTVDFEDSARDLPQQEIRSAIAAELERETLAEAGAAGTAAPRGATAERVAVGLDEQGLWVKYQGPRGLVERHLPVPERADQIPTVVSLAVGNLVRQEAFELLRELDRQRAERAKREQQQAAANEARRRAFAAEPQPRPKPRPVTPRPVERVQGLEHVNSLGVFFSTEVAMFPGVDGVCTPESIDPDLKCYRGGSPYRYSPPAGVQGRTKVRTGFTLGSTRFMVAYSRHLQPSFIASIRAGMAVTGGGVVPWFGEIKLQHVWDGWADGKLRPYSFLSFGVMRVEVTRPVEFTEKYVGQGGLLASDHGDVTAVDSRGWAFVSQGFGLRAALGGRWHLEYDLGWLLIVPDMGSLVRVGLGVTYDF